eukprot:gene23338-5563_t
MDKKYSVLEPIGSGGFARVYHGKRKSDGCDVAIKIINKHEMQRRGVVSRVRNEVEIHSRLDHPSVLRLLEFFEDK